MILNFLKGFDVNGKRKATNFENKILQGIKLHTIRIDEFGRWRAGRLIQFSTGARTEHYNCFKEGICRSVQSIEFNFRSIWINGEPLTEDEIQYLADNDGFDCLEDFWAWFDQYNTFTGKIIHWTTLKY